MISKSEKSQLKKYRHLIAALIEQSLGYFTPIAALGAINAHKNKETYGCEWYLHMPHQRIKFDFGGNVSPEKYDEILLQINHDTIKEAVRRRHVADLKYSLQIVDYNINGSESIAASCCQLVLKEVIFMGQYFRPILGDKDGFNCMVFDRSIDGEYMVAKLTEHSWWLNSFVNSFAHRLFNQQKRVCWTGDVQHK